MHRKEINMSVLKELPPGTIWPHLLASIEQQVIAEIESYSESRRNDVSRGAETAELAAALLDKYGSGMARALHIAGLDSAVQAVTDKLVREIDPDFDKHRQARWAARPASLSVVA